VFLLVLDYSVEGQGFWDPLDDALENGSSNKEKRSHSLLLYLTLPGYGRIHFLKR